MQQKARHLSPGSVIDVPADVVAGTENEQIQESEYAEVESVGGGWADAHAGEGQVVLYVPTWVAPIVIDGDRLIEVIEVRSTS